MTFTPFELYSVYFYNHAGNIQFISQDWTRLEYHQRINSSWNHQITLEFGSDSPRIAKYRDIQDDWMLRIYRTDPITSVKMLVYEGFNTTIVDQVKADGNIIINLYGVGFTDLLRRRVVVPLENETHNSKSGPAETVIKAYVADSMVSPFDLNRVFSGVGIETSAGAGKTVSYEARYIILYSICQTLAEDGNIDFGIVGGDNVGEFIFKARQIWGTDRRAGSTVTPVIFSLDYDNMVIPILSLNSSSEQNFAYVGGSGEGVDRIIVTVSNLEAISRSPWGRKEVFVESRQQSDSQTLITAGLAELNNRKKEQKLTFNIQQTIQSRWLRDWFLGDLVTATYFTYSFDKQITEIGVVVTSGQTAQQPEVISVELTDYEKAL